MSYNVVLGHIISCPILSHPILSYPARAYHANLIMSYHVFSLSLYICMYAYMYIYIYIYYLYISSYMRVEVMREVRIQHATGISIASLQQSHCSCFQPMYQHPLHGASYHDTCQSRGSRIILFAGDSLLVDGCEMTARSSLWLSMKSFLMGCPSLWS